MSTLGEVLVVVWLGTTSSHLHFQPHLQAWASARGVTLRAPASVPIPAVGYDAELVDHVERQFEQARVAAAAGDLAAVEGRLAEARELLLGAPELPQAGWLLAEAFNLEAELLPSPGDAWERARALAGPRARPYESADLLDDAPARELSLAVGGLHPGDVLIWDGEPQGPAVTTTAGLHHVRVLRGAGVVHSAFVSVAAGDARVDLPVPPPAACSKEDLGRPRLAARQVVPQASVRCPEWVAAAPGAGGNLLVARCQAARCGPLSSFNRFVSSAPSAPLPPAADDGWPAWASYAVLGAAGIAIGSVVLWQAGVFDGPQQPEPVWRYRPPE
ncbi:MAG TPA: hypothetical protein VKZ49_05475 [Polyangiaceae bacterium]|nr:hypothetical protein [Polyangiaceae bacterium]